MYASFLAALPSGGLLRALHLDIFEQPVQNRVFQQAVRPSRDIGKIIIANHIHSAALLNELSECPFSVILPLAFVYGFEHNCGSLSFLLRSFPHAKTVIAVESSYDLF